jgi:hypothetical protein
MITLLSPAKTLDFDSSPPAVGHSDLLFAEKAAYLSAKLAKMKPLKLRQMMDISEDLAMLNFERYQNWALPVDSKVGRQAIFAFKGDVYQGLKAESFSNTNLQYAQTHLRILSGLYGALRPLDLILPYRLEMGTSWQITPKNKNLYVFWKKEVTKQLEEDLVNTKSKVLLNLASQEYAKVVDFKKLKVPVISPDFREERAGKYQMISFFAKKARGMMAAFAAINEIYDVEMLKEFSEEGYVFNARLSDVNNNKWVYTRKS